MAITLLPMCSFIVLLNVLRTAGTGKSVSVRGKLFFANMCVKSREQGALLDRDRIRNCIVVLSQEHMDFLCVCVCDC